MIFVMTLWCKDFKINLLYIFECVYKTAELGIKLAFNSFKLAIVSHNILWFGPPSREHINWND